MKTVAMPPCLSLMALCFGATLSTAATALTPAELFAKVSPSVWRIRTYDKDGLPVA